MLRVLHLPICSLPILIPGVPLGHHACANEQDIAFLGRDSEECAHGEESRKGNGVRGEGGVGYGRRLQGAVEGVVEEDTAACEMLVECLKGSWVNVVFING